MHYLIVEDNEDLADAIAKRIRSDGHIVEIATTIANAIEFLSMVSYDLVILDINLPDGHGYEIIKIINDHEKRTPIVVLTAKLEIDHKIDALDLGADDYIVKPFDLEELIARMKAVIRRSENSGIKDISLGNVIFNSTKNTFILNNKQLILTKLEMRLLETFVRRPHHIFERSYLIDKLYPLDTAVSPNAIELVVSRLRKKLSGSGIEIKTLRGLGYQAQEQEYD